MFALSGEAGAPTVWGVLAGQNLYSSSRSMAAGVYHAPEDTPDKLEATADARTDVAMLIGMLESHLQ